MVAAGHLELQKSAVTLEHIFTKFDTKVGPVIQACVAKVTEVNQEDCHFSCIRKGKYEIQ